MKRVTKLTDIAKERTMNCATTNAATPENHAKCVSPIYKEI